MSLITVKMKFWTVTSPQLVYVNVCDLLPQFLLVTVKQAQKRKKVVNQRALIIKQVTCGVKLMKNKAMSLSLDPQVSI
jgi:hypothetical protein